MGIEELPGLTEKLSANSRERMDDGQGVEIVGINPEIERRHGEMIRIYEMRQVLIRCPFY
jgi:hypothetical protein